MFICYICKNKFLLILGTATRPQHVTAGRPAEYKPWGKQLTRGNYSGLMPRAGVLFRVNDTKERQDCAYENVLAGIAGEEKI